MVNTNISRVYSDGPIKRKYPVSRSCVEEEDLMMSEVRMGRLVADHRKATVSQTDSGDNQDKQSSVTAHTTRPSLKQFIRKFPHRPLFYDPVPARYA